MLKHLPSADKATSTCIQASGHVQKTHLWLTTCKQGHSVTDHQKPGPVSIIQSPSFSWDSTVTDQPVPTEIMSNNSSSGNDLQFSSHLHFLHFWHYIKHSMCTCLCMPSTGKNRRSVAFWCMPPVGKYIIFIYLCIFFISAAINVFSIKSAQWYLDNQNIFNIVLRPSAKFKWNFSWQLKRLNMSKSPAALVV